MWKYKKPERGHKWKRGRRVLFSVVHDERPWTAWNFTLVSVSPSSLFSVSVYIRRERTSPLYHVTFVGWCWKEQRRRVCERGKKVQKKRWKNRGQTTHGEQVTTGEEETRVEKKRGGNTNLQLCVEVIPKLQAFRWGLTPWLRLERNKKWQMVKRNSKRWT